MAIQNGSYYTEEQEGEREQRPRGGAGGHYDTAMETVIKMAALF